MFRLIVFFSCKLLDFPFPQLPPSNSRSTFPNVIARKFRFDGSCFQLRSFSRLGILEVLEPLMDAAPNSPQPQAPFAPPVSPALAHRSPRALPDIPSWLPHPVPHHHRCAPGRYGTTP